MSALPFDKLPIFEAIEFASRMLLYPPVTGFVMSLALVWSRRVPNVMLRAWFAATLVCCGLMLGLVGNLLRLANRLGLLSMKVYQQRLRQACAFVMHVHRRFNPHVRMAQGSGSMPWSDIRVAHILMANHTSFQDLFGGLWIVPLKYMSLMRIFFKGSLVNTPIIGPLLPEAGMFPVHYVSTNYDDFTVARDKQAVVMEAADQYLQTGGSLMLAPEGVVNRNPRQLTDFRVGSFALAIKYKLPLYYIVYCGHDDVWPPGWNIGGNAADVLYFIGKLPVDYTTPDSPDLDAKALSLKLKVVMQARLDILYAERDRRFGRKL
jgi:1-acyl-sn-glycerol-3-phosphate acyltransferase